MKFAGAWHITEMDEWDEDYCNMEVQAFIKIKKDGGGEFQFGLVRGYFSSGWLDEDGQSYEFDWEGGDEMDEASGSCLLSLTDKNHIEGEIRFFNGDSSGFQAVRVRKRNT